ncbi:AbrB/MazE/SpoVT family DNA-binding domain-containing protein [Candidatus Woesearchaeota archaeon]|nr:AbrB/MazE/SpoVT family DNA-binding domain-containing protein [Candidatus Woesearchaeota archaeon]
MQLQAQISREYQGTKYEKFWIVIPSRVLEKLNWKKGQELNAEVKNDKLIIEKNK